MAVADARERPRPGTAWFAALALCLVAAATVRSAIVTRLDDFTVDEVYHAVAGATYVQRGDFRINPEHPPLVKLWVGGVISALGFRLSPFRVLNDKVDEHSFVNDDAYAHNDAARLQRQTRAAMWALNATLLLGFTFALRRQFDPWVALGTLLFLCIDPTVAAHLPVVMTDLPVALVAATALVLAGRAFTEWSWSACTACFVVAGLALATKHSAPVVCADLMLAGTACALLQPPGRAGGSRARRLALLMGTACLAVLVLWAAYAFRFTESGTAQETFNRPLADKIADVHSPAYRWSLGQAARHHLLPRAYIWGLADVVRGGVEGRITSRLVLGKAYWGNPPAYFFPLVIAVKLPLGLSALVIMGLAAWLLGRLPATWRVPGALVALGIASFLGVLTQAAGYGGIRHALPVVVLLSVFAGFALRFAAVSPSAALRLGVAASLLAAMVSAVPALRPWEYYNELIGTESAYLFFNDEGVDLFQRFHELARYYHEVLEPAHELPVLDYVPSEQQGKFLGLDWIGHDPARDAHFFDSPVFTGTIILNARSLSPRLYADLPRLRAALPMARFGNLFVFRGTFDISPILAEGRFQQGLEKLAASPPDLAGAEAQFRASAAMDPASFYSFIEVGNLCLARGARAEALDAYEAARDHAPVATVFRQEIEEQLRRVVSGPLAAIRPLRDPAVE